MPTPPPLTVAKLADITLRGSWPSHATPPLYQRVYDKVRSLQAGEVVLLPIPREAQSNPKEIARFASGVYNGVYYRLTRNGEHHLSVSCRQTTDNRLAVSLRKVVR